MKIRREVLSLVLGIAAILSVSLGSSLARAETREILETAVEINGVKFWFPSTITVKKGDKVKIRAVSKVPGNGSVHGFKIEGYNVEVVADDKGKDAEFVANKTGIFKFFCHMHPAHVGGQIVVIE